MLQAQPRGHIPLRHPVILLRLAPTPQESGGTRQMASCGVVCEGPGLGKQQRL